MFFSFWEQDDELQSSRWNGCIWKNVPHTSRSFCSKKTFFFLLILFMYISIFWVFFLLFLGSCTSPSDIPSQEPNWTSQTLSHNSSILYVDVREDDEWALWHINGAIHLKLWDIESGKVSTLPKDTPLAIYCRSGRRSKIAVDALQKLGYPQSYDVGGMTALKNVTIIR